MQGLAGHHARKRFGQNFLADSHWIDRIVEAIDPRPGESIVEIGPGQAALTRRLIAAAGRVTAVEIDRDLAAWLRREFPAGALDLIEADALALDWAGILDGREIRVVGNLPYNISTPLLTRLSQAGGRILDQHFMLQREVVDRMVAGPGSKTYGRLSVALQVRYRMEKLFDVPPGAFVPAPKVTSSVVRMVPRPAADIPAFDPQAFERVVLAAFCQRRKTLRNALSGLVDPEGFAAADVDPALRAEAVPVAGFVALARAARPDATPASSAG